ncbi:MAG TPA: hypothetical protein VK066_31000 [Chloroflexota bacterium]|nr:hypothetical protein [Chloroflexota bacterium]
MTPWAGGGRQRRCASALLLLATVLAGLLGPLWAPGTTGPPSAGDAVAAPLAPPPFPGPALPRPVLPAPPAAEAAVLRAATDQDQSARATLEMRQPDVQWSPAGAGGWQSVPDRQDVTAGDRVRTGPAASARLVYFEGTVTDIGPETGLLVQRLERGPDGNVVTSLFQAVGTTVSRVVHTVGQPADFQVETPAAFAFVRGTVPRVIVDADGTTRVANLPDGTESIVVIQGKDPDQTELRLPPGLETLIRPGLAPEAPTAVQAAESNPPAEAADTTAGQTERQQRRQQDQARARAAAAEAQAGLVAAQAELDRLTQQELALEQQIAQLLAPTPVGVPPPASGQGPCATVVGQTCIIAGPQVSGTATKISSAAFVVTATGLVDGQVGGIPTVFIPTTVRVESFPCDPITSGQTARCSGQTVGDPLQGATVTVRYPRLSGDSADAAGRVTGPGLPSPTATATRTATPSATATRTGTPFATATGTSIPSATSTSSPTGAPTATFTATPTVGSTTSPTTAPTPSPTPTASPTLTASATPTDTPGPTATPSSTATPTLAAGNTPTPSPTATPPVSATDTPTPSPTITSSPTLTPTVAPSATVTPSPTATITLSATLSPTATITPSVTLSPTATTTPSLTPSPTGSATASPTATLTPAATLSPTASATPSPTATITPSATPSPTATITPSATATTTPSVTLSPTATATPSATATITPSATPTHAATPTATPVPCGIQTTSGSATVTRTTHDLGVSSGTFRFTYQAFTIPDQFDIYYEGALIYTTGGPVSNGNTVDVAFGPGASTTVDVVVTKSTPQSGWNYTVSCPT